LSVDKYFYKVRDNWLLCFSVCVLCLRQCRQMHCVFVCPSSVCPDRYCYRDTSWMAWAISM